ncbi:golgin A5 isoform X2 [Oratosquilla oratoria]|uniref:golgin A5 isoform X2 n=1 Tax=Oratosquilla oratoria TaxID=337810 RepID=UPI003F7614FF
MRVGTRSSLAAEIVPYKLETGCHLCSLVDPALNNRAKGRKSTMSWFAEMAGKAENLLNQIDSQAGVVLSKENTKSGSSKTTYKYNMASAVPGPPQPPLASLQSSSSVPNNLSSYGLSSSGSKSSSHGNGGSLTSSPKARSLPNKKESQDAELMAFSRPQAPSSTVPHKIKADIMSSSFNSSQGHSRQSSVSSVSSFTGLSDQETPMSTAVDIETGSIGSASGSSTNTDAYVTVETPVDISITPPTSAEMSSNGSSNTGHTSLMSGSLESETVMLRKEVASLTQEMAQVLRRAKEAEKEAQYFKHQVTSHQISSDRLIRELQQREMDLQEALHAKDTQLAVLHVRLQEADQEIAGKKTVIDELNDEKERLLVGVHESSGLQSQALQSAQDYLADVQNALDCEKRDHAATRAELAGRISQTEEEQKGFLNSVADLQKKLDDEKRKSSQISTQMITLKTDLTAARDDLLEYKAKASRILQSKEKLIASLKEGTNEDMEAGREEIHIAELDQLRQERDLIHEELDQSASHVQQLRAELSDMEAMAQEEARIAAQNLGSKEEELGQEKKLRLEAETEWRQAREELRCAHEEITRHKVNIATRLQQRDDEIERLRKQIAHKQSSFSSQNELETRLHALTESLVHKQTTIEAITTEKNSLLIQMERLQYQDSQKMLNRDHSPTYHTEEVRNRVPSFLVESPFDGGISLRVKRAYTTLDKFSIRLGVFLRRYPIARVFVIMYMGLLHLWVMIVLLTYTPEIHGSEFHAASGTQLHSPHQG